MNKKSKNLFKGAAAVIGVILVIIAGTKIMPDGFRCTWLGTRLYPGDRIKVNLYITVDGKMPELSKSDNRAYELKKGNGCYKISERANDYDLYEYNLVLYEFDLMANETIPLTLQCSHLNWWEITRSNLYIDIDTKTKTYKVHEDYRYTVESCPFNYIKECKEDEKTVEDLEIIYEAFGPKG